MTIKELNLQNFEEEIIKQNQGKLKVIKFGADWCGPCRMLAPILKSVASKFSDKADIYEVDADVNPELSMQFGVRGIPAVFFLKDGKVVDQFVGLRGEKDFEEVIKERA